MGRLTIMNGKIDVHREGDGIIVVTEFGEANVSFDHELAAENLDVDGVEWDDLSQRTREELLVGQTIEALRTYVGEPGVRE